MYNALSDATLMNVTFSGNTAGLDGGSVYNFQSNPTLTHATISSNTADRGGGMYNGDSSPTLTNVTFSGNSAQYGGGIWNSVDSDSILIHVTISGNSALSGGGLYSESVTTPTLSNTILAGNSAVSGPDCYGTIISGNYNLIGDPFFCDISPQTNDQIGIDPLLGPLADNGGETQTRALLTGSPAIDWIPYGVNGCGTTITSDQRGEARPIPAGGNCDIGAYEYAPPPLPETGFPTGMVTALPAQPTEKAYTALGELWLELPDLGVQAPIVSVPFAGGGWDVSWLGSSAGYLPGSAFPTWPGNTVLTGHVWDAHNRPGIFVDLKQLRYNDRIAIHAWGATYLYAVRESRLISPQAVDIVMQHKELDWVTLLTCEDYRFNSEGYIFRRMVRAVLVEVVPDR
jgi:LPXTG-site transpeptidase (sortase) family protein